MTYSGFDIAKVIIFYGNQHNIPINNLKLQKLLYLLWVDYYKETHQHLFEERFYAWAYGPAVPSIYYVYYLSKSAPLASAEAPKLTPFDKRWLIAALGRYVPLPVKDLVDMVRKSGSPWEKVYKKRSDGQGKFPFRSIELSVSMF